MSNYYSYDDNGAEYAAGLNQKNSELVLKYNLLKKDTKNTYLHIVFNNVGIKLIVFPLILYVKENKKEIMKNVLGDCVVN